MTVGYLADYSYGNEFVPLLSFCIILYACFLSTQMKDRKVDREYLGGPAVGDIRSRCLRLSGQSTSEARAVRILLGHRLPLDARRAKSEW